MRIVCPTCQAAYEVPESLIGGAARKVRCARCGGAWVPQAVAPEATRTRPESEAGPELAQPPAASAGAATPGRALAPVVAPRMQAPERAAAEAVAAPDLEPDLPPPPLVAQPARQGHAPPVQVPRAAEMLAPPDTPPTAARRPGVMLAVLGWAATLAVLGGGVWAAVTWRGAVMAAWPPSARLYMLLGLH